MYFTFSSKKRIEQKALAGYKAHLTIKTLFFFQKQLESGIANEREDLELNLLPALELALKLELITADTYRQIKQEAASADNTKRK